MITTILAGLILLFTIKLYFDHQRQGLNSAYKEGNYKNINPLKHDLIKELTVSLFVLMVFGKDFDLAIKILVATLGGLFIYYHLVEPYIANKIGKF